MFGRKFILAIAILIYFAWVNGNTNFLCAETNSPKASIKPALTYNYFKLSSVFGIKLEGNPQKPALSPQGDFILVPAKDLDALYYISLTKKKPILQDFTIPVGKSPVAVVFNNSGKIACVANEEDKSISILKLKDSDSEIIQTINLTSPPTALAISKDNKYLFVTTKIDNSLNVIKLEDENSRVINKVSVGKWPNSIKLSLDNEKAFIVNRGENTITEVDISFPMKSLQTKEIQVGTYPIDIALSKTGDAAIVTNLLDNSLSIIDPIDNPPVEYNVVQNLSRPMAISSDASNDYAIVINSDGGKVAFYDLKYSSQKNIIPMKHDTVVLEDNAEFMDLNAKTNTLTVTHPKKELISIVKYSLVKKPVEIINSTVVTPGIGTINTLPPSSSIENIPVNSGNIPNTSPTNPSQVFNYNPNTGTPPASNMEFINSLFKTINGNNGSYGFPNQ